MAKTCGGEEIRDRTTGAVVRLGTRALDTGIVAGKALVAGAVSVGSRRTGACTAVAVQEQGTRAGRAICGGHFTIRAVAATGLAAGQSRIKIESPRALLATDKSWQQKDARDQYE